MAAGKRQYTTLFVTLVVGFVASGCASLGIGDESSPEDLARQRLGQAIESRDIVLGMAPQQVIQAWGQPREVEYAGRPGTGNERWLYYQGLSQRFKLEQTRIVYFEAGQVAGWETR